MNERDEIDIIPGGGGISDEVGERVRTVLIAAEDAARAIRSEAEQHVHAQRRAAELQRQRILATAQAGADALLDERIKGICDLRASLHRQSDALRIGLDGAQEVHEQFEALAESLASVAELLARERDLAGSVPAVEALDEAKAESEAAEPDAPRTKRTPESLREDAGTRGEVDGDRGASVTTPRRATDDLDFMQLLSPADLLLRRNDDSAPAARLVAVQMAVAGADRGDVDQHLRRAFGVEEPGKILGDVFGDGGGTGARFTWADKVPQ